jgi:hypothetical protein
MAKLGVLAVHSAALQKESTCSVCLERFTQPVMLTCGHTFCRVCAETVRHLFFQNVVDIEVAVDYQALQYRQKCPVCCSDVSKKVLVSNTALLQILPMIEAMSSSLRADDGGKVGGLLSESVRKRFCEVTRRAEFHEMEPALSLKEGPVSGDAALLPFPVGAVVNVLPRLWPGTTDIIALLSEVIASL